MKKNISINISGIIFHIEEDGYETLKKYLDSINRYFSTFEDSSEILADIESRIAEIFLAKLNEEKQVITAEDVSALMATMGSVNDFKAVEEQEQKERAYEEAATEGPAGVYEPPKRLFRDQKRKILGGVCAGLGSYFNTDPLWIRLLFAALLFVYGFTAVVYVIMWIIVPGSWDLKEPNSGRKMFRDPETKVIGGVSGGVAAFMGIDIILVRVLFILLALAGGLGVFLYIILWVCLPEARTLTDKMQMQGEPVTLSNIESTIKRNFNIREGEGESTLTRILLFPFRLIGAILTGLGKVLGPLAEVVRVIIGIAILFMGLAMVFGIVVTGAALFGILAGEVFLVPWMAGFDAADLPLEVFTRAFPGWVAVAALVAALVPAIFLVLLGASVIARKMVFQATAGWALLALFFVSVVMLAVGVPRIIYAVHEDGAYRIEQVYEIPGDTAVLRVNSAAGSEYDGARLTLRGYEGEHFKLLQSFEAHGSSRQRAIENARMVEYNVTLNDSTLTFDEDIRFREDAVFRGQHLDMVLYIPYHFPFIMDEGMSRFISQYVDGEYLDGYVWQTTREGLECINCHDGSADAINDLRDFEEIEISGRFELRIIQGETYAVEVSGSDADKQQYRIHRAGQTLLIEHERRSDVDWENFNVDDLGVKEVEIVVTLPKLQRLEAMGIGTIRLQNIRGDDLEIDTRGPVEVRGEVYVDDLTIRLTGRSEADLSGTAKDLNARIELASKLRAYDLEAGDAFVEAAGASSARVNVSGTLEMDEGVASDIDYRGQPQVVRHD